MTGNELKAEAFVKSLSVYAGKGYPVFYVNKHFVIQPPKGILLIIQRTPLAYKVPEAGLGQPARIQGSVPWTSSGH